MHKNTVTYLKCVPSYVRWRLKKLKLYPVYTKLAEKTLPFFAYLGQCYIQVHKQTTISLLCQLKPYRLDGCWERLSIVC